MANYNITKTDGTSITIIDQTLNNTFSFGLLGQNYIGYGQTVAQNTLRFAENFAGDSAPSKAIRGQLWFETTIPNAPDATGSLKVWTGYDPTDVGYIFGTHDSALGGNYSKWVSVVGSADDIGSLADPITNIYVDNVYATYGEFESIFIGDNVTNYGVTINETSISPAPDCVVSIGDASNKFDKIYACDMFAFEEFTLGDTGGSFHAKMIPDTANANTIIPSAPQQINIGHASSAAKRFASVNTKITNTDTLVVSTGASNGLNSVLEPITNNSIDLGSTTYRYRDVFSYTVTADSILRQTSTSTIGQLASPFLAMYAVTFEGTATQAKYADLAERYEADKVYDVGTVVELGGTKQITETKNAMSTDVFGVISHNPAFLMNKDAGTHDTHPPVAFSGKIPVKVIGNAKKGDRLVSSPLPGVAISISELGLTIDNISAFCVIGRSLEDKNDDDVRTIEVVVGAK